MVFANGVDAALNLTDPNHKDGSFRRHAGEDRVERWVVQGVGKGGIKLSKRNPTQPSQLHAPIPGERLAGRTFFSAGGGGQSKYHGGHREGATE